MPTLPSSRRPLVVPRALAMLAALVAAVAVLSIAPPAWAHPLGLPATARIVRTAEAEVVVRWAAQPDDVAALAVAAGLHERDGGGGAVAADASLTASEDAALAASDQLRALVLREMAVVVDGERCAPTLRPQPTVAVHGIEVVFACPGPADEVAVSVGLLHGLDARYRTLGAATTPDGERQVMFTGADPTHELALVEVGTATAGSDGPTGGEASPDRSDAAAPTTRWGGTTEGFSGMGMGMGMGMGWLDDRFLAAIDRPAGAVASALGLLLALAVGAVHALAPGHGKAIAAAYLVGDNGRRRDAVVLGSTVALMHTGSVLLLGFALYSAARAPDAARLGASIEAGAGAIFVALGGWLLWRRWTARRRGRSHGHGDDHTHAHGHDGRDHAHRTHHTHHTHHEADPTSAGHVHAGRVRGRDEAEDASHLQRVVALGAAGGLLPSPSALLVLLTALAIGRLAYGLALVGAFSIGLAATLTAVGLAVLSGRDLAQRRLPARFHGWLHAAPLFGAFAVVALGGIVLARALLRLA